MPTLSDKLHPDRFPRMSGKMVAIVGYILGVGWTHPSIVEMVVTSDGFVLARNEGHLGFDTFIGSLSDLERNWENLLSAAKLTSEERRQADGCYRKAVRSCRQPQAQP